MRHQSGVDLGKREGGLRSAGQTGWDISNINILMDNSHESMDPAIGATNLRVCLCNIAPAEEANE